MSPQFFAAPWLEVRVDGWLPGRSARVLACKTTGSLAGLAIGHVHGCVIWSMRRGPQCIRQVRSRCQTVVLCVCVCVLAGVQPVLPMEKGCPLPTRRPVCYYQPSGARPQGKLSLWPHSPTPQEGSGHAGLGWGHLPISRSMFVSRLSPSAPFVTDALVLAPYRWRNLNL